MDGVKKPLRIGMVGTNFVSEWFCEAVRASDCARVEAICSRSADTAKRFAAERGIENIFCDFDEFVDFQKLDAIYLASPNMLHERQALAALSAGKHVLCEKPLGMNRMQAQAMFDFAREKKLVLMEAIRPIHDPFIQALRESLPRLGRITRGSFDFCQYSSRYDRFKAGERINAFDPSLGNGALMDLALYALHCAIALFGKPKSVSAGASFLENGFEAAGSILLCYDDKQVTISYSKINEGAFPSVIEGENGTLAFDKLNQPSYLSFIDRKGKERRREFAPRPNNMVYEIRDFCACAEGSMDAAPFEAQTMEVLAVMDAARAQTGLRFACEEKA